MKISDEISLSARNLLRRKGRTALTLVGVVIGTCMVVLMISLGIAQNQANDEMIQSWGDLTQIEIYGGGISVGSDGKAIKLDDAALTQIRELGHVLAATPFTNPYNLNGTITAGRNNRYVTNIGSITALDPVALEPMGFALESGRWLDTNVINAQSKKIPVLVCEYTGYNFYDSRRSENSPKRYRWQGETDANGNELPPFVDVDKDKFTLTITTGDDANAKSQTWELEVVGKLQQDVSKGWWTQSGIIMSMQNLKVIEAAYNKMEKIKNTDSSYDQVYVKVDDLKNVGDVEEAIHELGFQNTWSSNQQREDMQKQVFRSQMIFGGVAAVSLLVAAINIINTMTMAIYERTREIGVMKVLGCEIANIRTMFLMESSCIGFIGGVLGVLISLLVSLILNNLTTIMASFGQYVDLSGIMGGYGASSSTISIIPPWLMLGALVFATLIGLISGILPANKAVKISALEAIRHD